MYFIIQEHRPHLHAGGSAYVSFKRLPFMLELSPEMRLQENISYLVASSSLARGRKYGLGTLCHTTVKSLVIFTLDKQPQSHYRTVPSNESLK